jgi:hypothetical protein
MSSLRVCGGGTSDIEGQPNHRDGGRNLTRRATPIKAHAQWRESRPAGGGKPRAWLRWACSTAVVTGRVEELLIGWADQLAAWVSEQPRTQDYRPPTPSKPTAAT